MKTDNLVSIIIPTYNRGSLIQETLESIKHQTYRPLEVIVIDDGSTDQTKFIVEAWNEDFVGQSDDSFRLRYVWQNNSGGCRARNHGVSIATGDYINYLDSDDIISPNKIKQQVAVLSKQPKGIVAYGDWRAFIAHHDGSIDLFEQSNPIKEDNALIAWLEGWFVLPHCMLWHRSDVDRLGLWDESLKSDQDGDYSMRFLLNGGQLLYTPGAWSYYRQYEIPGQSVAGTNRRDSFISRYKVIRKIELALANRGDLDIYRDSLAIRYAQLANRSALFDGSLANKCLYRATALATDGKLPNIFTFPFVSKCIGLHNKQRIGSYIRAILRRKPMNHSSMRPEARVNSVHELAEYDR